MEPSAFIALTSKTPVFALAVAYATSRQPLDAYQLGGVAFILGGIGIEFLRPKLEIRSLS
jgi:drug/metabolite transporter (DMT)-like permease